MLCQHILKKKSDEEIYNEHTDLFPREVKANQEIDSKFFVTFFNKDNIGIDGYNDYFDENGKTHFRTNLKVYESYGGDLDKVSDMFNNPLCDECVEFDVYMTD